MKQLSVLDYPYPSLSEPLDLVILTNGPGEVTTWLLPVLREIERQIGIDSNQVRISVVLSPCPHSTGKEAEICASYPQVDRVLAPQYFNQFLVWGKTPESWHWRKKGVVIFLGGDQFYTVVIGKRLGYKTLVYGEWDARWYRWIDRFGVASARVEHKVPSAYRHKVKVVGNLMADLGQIESPRDSSIPTIGILPGSKSAKLAQGVPLCVAIAHYFHQLYPRARFLLPLAPTLDLGSLANFADPDTNPLVAKMGGISSAINTRAGKSYLKTADGLEIEIITDFPAFAYLAQCDCCLTTVGANTAQLACLGIPMVVLLPTQQLEAMRSWDGIPGILANLPGVGTAMAKIINRVVLARGKLFAWANIWAQEEIVPELVGQLNPQEVAQLLQAWFEDPQKLDQIRVRLREVAPPPGAARSLVEILQDLL